jgi:flagellar biosynthesis anti-sigma factor FlgM
MKLSDINQKVNSLPQVNQADKSNISEQKKISPEIGKELTASDKVELSDQSKIINKIREVLEMTPEIRSERVMAMKKAIEEGQFHVKTEAVTDQMIKTSVFELKHG